MTHADETDLAHKVWNTEGMEHREIIDFLIAFLQDANRAVILLDAVRHTKGNNKIIQGALEKSDFKTDILVSIKS